MRIIYLHQFFVTPAMTGITRSYELAKRLVQAGHEVHVVTSHASSPPTRGQVWSETVEGGAHVHWLHEGLGLVGDNVDPVGHSNKLSYADRIRTFIRFALQATGKVVSLNGDVLYFSSPPPTTLLPALVAHFSNGIPLVGEIRDLYPEVAVELGGLTNPVAIGLLQILERVRVGVSSHITTASPAQREAVIERGMPAERVAIVSNSADLDLFDPDRDGAEFRQKHGLGDGFCAVYFGKFGLSNGLDYVLDAAKILHERGETGIRIVLVGDGQERIRMEQRVDEENLTNVRILPPVSKQEVIDVAAAADVALTVFRNSPVLQGGSPNKFFDGLAAGRPILTNLPGWIEGLVGTHQCGRFAPPDDPAAFADELVWLRDHPEERKAMGQRARHLAETQFARDTVGATLERVLRAAGGNAIY